MTYDLSNPLHAESFKKRCNSLFLKRCVVELTERKPQRTLSQNAYLHAILGFFGLQNGYTIEEVKRWFFKETCNRELFVIEKYDKINNITRKSLRSSASLTTEEMTLAIERFRNWAAQVADLYIPTPDEHRLVQQMQIEVERAKMFL